MRRENQFFTRQILKKRKRVHNIFHLGSLASSHLCSNTVILNQGAAWGAFKYFEGYYEV